MLQRGAQRAVVTDVGATLCEYSVDGHAVVDGFAAGERAADGRGQVLAPWPNRLHEGRYSFNGRTCHAACDEPARHNAIHGLVRWLPWTLRSSESHTATLACTLHPQPAYVWLIELEVTYALGEDGLTVTTEVVNRADEPAPFGLGFHPYLTLGQPIDELVLTVPAATNLTGSDDFTQPRVIGATVLDNAFTDLARDGDGRAVARLATADGDRAIDLWVDERFGWLMVYSADGVSDPARRRSAIAIEPMTCPPNALQTGDDVVVLEPGVPWRAEWGIRPNVA